jgi:inhibitor of KinA sporulation pathway (predicted exonuclease)
LRIFFRRDGVLDAKGKTIMDFEELKRKLEEKKREDEYSIDIIGPMDFRELKRKLEKANIREDAYSIDVIGYTERYVISKVNNKKWEIYYSERGLKTGLKEFDNEDEACKAFLIKLLKSHTVKQ